MKPMLTEPHDFDDVPEPFKVSLGNLALHFGAKTQAN